MFIRPVLRGSLFIFLEGEVIGRLCKNGMGHTYLISSDVNFFRKYQLPQTAHTRAFTTHFALTFFQNLTTKGQAFQSQYFVVDGVHFPSVWSC